MPQKQPNHHHGFQELPGAAKYCTPGAEHHRSDRFGRLFGDLPPNYVPSRVLIEIGKANGPMDGGDNPPRTDSVPVGHVFFGQFVDHDITLDVTSSLDHNQNAHDTPNVRTPTLDLDCIYGSGPEAQPYLYDPDGRRLLTGADVAGAGVEVANDLQRNAAGRAMIGDFRNDENRIVSQLQLGMIKFHNANCDRVEARIRAEHPGVANEQLEFSEVFEVARQMTTWHYQWCVVYDLLYSMCGKPVVDDILTGGRAFYCGGEAYIPVEFSIAAYRFGHSMVPMKIQVQKNDNSFELFGAILGRGFEPVGDERAIVDWHELFDTPEGRDVQNTLKLDTQLAHDLLRLSVVADDQPPEAKSLPSRNLRRGNVFLLPAGEVVARHMQEHLELTDQQIDDVMARVKALTGDAIDGRGAPLWLYILAEAEVVGRTRSGSDPEPGEGLGPVGARIVAEVIIGLMEMDPRSFLGANRNWVPNPDFDEIGKLLASTNWSGLPT